MPASESSPMSMAATKTPTGTCPLVIDHPPLTSITTLLLAQAGWWLALSPLSCPPRRKACLRPGSAPPEAHEHRHKDHDADDDLLDEAGDAENVQAICEHPHQQQPEGGADHGATAAEERRTSYAHRRDRLEFQSAPDQRLSRIHPPREQNAADPGEQAAERVNVDEVTSDRDPREHGRGLASSDRVERHAVTRARKDQVD